MRCPDGGRCNRAGLTFNSMETESGFWRNSNKTLKFERCLLPEHCDGGAGQGVCLDHREGPLCSLCKEGYVLHLCMMVVSGCARRV